MKDLKNEFEKIMYISLMTEDAVKSYNNHEISEEQYNDILKVILDLEEKIINDYEINKKKLNGSVVDKVPEGWTLNDTQTTPVGYHKYCNNKSHFKGDYDWCLIKDNNKNEI